MVELHLFQYLLIGIGALMAGIVNALAGGGTLITFPLLTAVGLPAVAANVTNTLALCPGYFGATLAQLEKLRTQKKRVIILLPAAIIGGIAGGLLLLKSGEKLFSGLVPYLILLASVLLALGEPLRKMLAKRRGEEESPQAFGWIAFPAVILAGVYGGYFGAGLGVILLAVLGVLFRDSLTTLNALKQALSLAINVAAAIYFLFSGKICWPAVLVMAVCALGGGWVGGKLVGKINPLVLRWIVVGIGLTVAIVYFIK